jgi:hypothetical protein
MDDLLRLLPPIRRTRGNRLYAADGRRFLDLWLDDGRGILGDRDRHTRTYAANAADKGLTRPYPGLYEARFFKAVRHTWPGFSTVKVFSSEERAKAWAGTNPLAVARPFAMVPDACDLAMPRLPCPRPYAPWCLIARDGTQAAAALAQHTGDLVPAQSLYAAARGLASLESAVRDGYGEELWARFDKRLGAWFERSGPYLTPKIPPEKHGEFFRAALEGGALVSPRLDAPSMVPPDFDDGELAKLAKALGKAFGG